MFKRVFIVLVFGSFLSGIGCLTETQSNPSDSDEDIGTVSSASSNPFCDAECFLLCSDACAGLTRLEDRLSCRHECTRDCERSFCPI